MSSLEIQKPASASSGLGNKLVLGKLLHQSRNEIRLAFCPETHEYFAVKTFPYDQGKVSSHFLNESRFSFLDNKHVISMKDVSSDGAYELVGAKPGNSYLVMELAPFGNFYDLLTSKRVRPDEKLARTYFRQLIEGIEYLHAHGVAHLDLKPHNLLIGNNFQLKIADFDLSLIEGDSTIKGKGSKFYRAPELLGSNIRAPELADIYSAGIFLFLLKTRGTLPHTEGMKYKGVNLFELMNEDNDKFWKTHLEFLGEEDNFFDEDFKNLFNSMTKKKAKDRASIQEIKKSKWYNGPIYDDKELIRVMSHYIPNNSRTV